MAGAVSRPFTPQVGCLESLLKLKKAFTRRSFVVATDNVPVISSRPCMVSAADKSAMQQNTAMFLLQKYGQQLGL